MSDLNELKAWLHELHGNRICTVEQHLSAGDVREAALSQGELDGLTAAITAIERLEDGHEREQRPIDADYRALSKRRFEVDRAAAETSDDGSIRGFK